MPTQKKISIIITCHSESILLHRTILSVIKSAKELSSKYYYEIIVHADKPSNNMLLYLETMSKTFPKILLFKNNFGDLGMSRNFAIKKSSGEYIATIDADDLFCRSWLKTAVEIIDSTKELSVIHSELTVEFEGANIIVIKEPQINQSADALLSVYTNRWNSIILAPKQLLLEEPYMSNSPGYGYEDWNLNCRLIARGVKNILAPKTVIFVRRKKSESEWLRQSFSNSLLKSNPLLSFDYIHKIDKSFRLNNEIPQDGIEEQINVLNIKYRIRNKIKRYPYITELARPLYKFICRLKEDSLPETIYFPDWLEKEYLEIHNIERQIFPSDNLKKSIIILKSITKNHIISGDLYKTLIDSLKYDKYGYIIFVPWLIRGGADKYAINYANRIAKEKTEKKVLVISTLPVESIWTNKLDDDVDFLDFGNITKDTTSEIKNRLMGHIIENSGATHIHIINSEFGYDYITSHKDYIDGSDKKIVLTSFSQSVDSDGLRIFGYSHTHVPQAYDLATFITSDNSAVINMWEKEYGFNRSKMEVHRQPINRLDVIEKNINKREFKVLWASRLAPEKLSTLVPKIGQLIENKNITIDMYGTLDNDFEMIDIELFPNNVSYKGPFSDFYSLPLNDYDIFLYTSLFDGMPNILLEAASVKLPIITSSVGGIPDFIGKSNGILIDDIHDPKSYADAITKLYYDPVLCKKYSSSAYNKIIKYYSEESYNKSVKEMLKKINYID